MRVTNIPKKGGTPVHGESKDHCYTIKSDGIICEIGRATTSQTVNDICTLVEASRDAGYQQALSDIRNFLGIK